MTIKLWRLNWANASNPIQSLEATRHIDGFYVVPGVDSETGEPMDMYVHDKHNVYTSWAEAWGAALRNCEDAAARARKAVRLAETQAEALRLLTPPEGT